MDGKKRKKNIYICIEGERDVTRKFVCVCVFIFIFIYLYYFFSLPGPICLLSRLFALLRAGMCLGLLFLFIIVFFFIFSPLSILPGHCVRRTLQRPRTHGAACVLVNFTMYYCKSRVVKYYINIDNYKIVMSHAYSHSGV